MKCCICGHDLAGHPAMVDRVTGEAFCYQDREYFGLHPSNRPRRAIVEKPRGQEGKIANPDVNIQKAMATLEDAYLVRHDEELEKRVNYALDLISAGGEVGIKALLERLYRDMRLVGSNLQVMFGGDEAWNEWLRKRAVLEALGRARAKSAVPQLVPFLSAQSTITQFYEILQPAVVRALGEIGDKRAVEPLRKALRSNDVYAATLKAIGEALEKLEGHAPSDPVLIIAQADSLYKSGKNQEMLQALEQIDSQMFDALPDRDKYYFWYMRGEIYRKMGDKTKAGDCYRTSLKYFSDPTAVAYDRLRELGQSAESPSITTSQTQERKPQAKKWWQFWK